MNAEDETTRTAHYLIGEAKSSRRKNILRVLDPPLPSGRVPLGRLTCAVSSKYDYSLTDLRNNIDKHLQNAAIFCDTSLFDDATDVALWTTLLQIQGRVRITESVLEELSPWIDTHPDHIAARTIRNGEPWIKIARIGDLDQTLQGALLYYVNLLSRRRDPLIFTVNEFEKTHGRGPNKEEYRELRVELSHRLGPRGFFLAKKGIEERAARPRYTDEVLLCLAFITAIVTGRETMILTKDEDIFEQFYKLQWLLDTHYRGMLLAKRFCANPSSFAHHAFPCTDPRIDLLFAPDKRLLIERSPELLQQILPVECDLVPIYCWVVGEKFSGIAFSAERGLEDVLATKARTGGLNTEGLNGQNCHIWLAPLQIPMRFRGCAAIVEDNRKSVPTTNIRIPLFDIFQTIYCGEDRSAFSKTTD